MEKIDIIIPFLFVDEKLFFTLQSVYPFLNNKINSCICINDGFDDNPIEYKKKKEILFYNYEGNKGVSFARNYGLQKSSSKFVLFLDSGDQFLNISNLNSNYDIINFNHFNENNKLIDYKDISKSNIIRSLIWGEAKFWICSIIFKRSWLIQFDLNFKEGISWGEDVDFILRNILLGAEIGFNNTVLVKKIDDFNSLSVDAAKSTTKDIIRYFLFNSLNEIKKNKEINIFLSNFIIAIIYRDSKLKFLYFSQKDREFYYNRIDLKSLKLSIFIKYVYLKIILWTQ
jgi:glycosyltransferase involved in cell wall biosynthesis